jgi:hypothetical protein
VLATCPDVAESHEGAESSERRKTMKQLLQFVFPLGIAAAYFAALATPPASLPPQSTSVQEAAPAPDQTPLSHEQIRNLLAQTLANQHRNDASEDLFDRFEHRGEHSGSRNGPVAEEETFRVVPTGSGNLKLLIKESGHPVSDAQYQHELGDWQRILEVAIHPDDPRQAAGVAKQQKRLKERARFVDAVPDAYRVTWIGREIRDGRILEKLQFDPSSDYRPRGDNTDWLTHARATAWIDAQASQIVRVDAEITRDISIGAGIIGKVYHGGHFVLEQTQVAPGIWEPTQIQYDIYGRKFLFPFQMHEVTTISRYRYIGNPEKALAIARQDISQCCNLSRDP